MFGIWYAIICFYDVFVPILVMTKNFLLIKLSMGLVKNIGHQFICLMYILYAMFQGEQIIINMVLWNHQEGGYLSL